MSKVFVIQEVPGRDISSAKQYGEIEQLLPPGQVSFSAGAVVHWLRKKLFNYTAEDYLLLMGDPVAIGLACAVAAQSSAGKLRLLKWDRKQFRYYPLDVDTSGRIATD